jgi:NAD(P)-dependent dehydrogenase (short-subunit alcohol dehydrogenase family)
LSEVEQPARSVLITGAASGIGRATAERFARQGSRVTMCDVDMDELTSLAGQLAGDGLKCTPVRADVTSQADVDDLVRMAVGDNGSIEVLANVAGVMDWFLPAHELDDETWTRVMSVNVDGPMRLCRAVLPLMMRHGGGSIANVGSYAGHRGGAAGLAYTVSKHALTGLTRSIAWTYASAGVRCNIVLPGVVKTGIFSSGTPRSPWGYEQLGPVLAQSPRRAKAEEIASVITWLCSEDGVALNGAEVSADGGWSAG